MRKEEKTLKKFIEETLNESIKEKIAEACKKWQ